MADLIHALPTVALGTLVSLAVAALWRLGSVLVGLPAAIDRMTAVTSQHEKRITHLEEKMNGVIA